MQRVSWDNYSGNPGIRELYHKVLSRAGVDKPLSPVPQGFKGRHPVFLDVGGGAGIVKELLQERAVAIKKMLGPRSSHEPPAFTYMNLDIDPRQLSKSPAHKIQADRAWPPLKNNSVDYAIYFFPVTPMDLQEEEHRTETYKLTQMKIAKALKTGGKLILLWAQNMSDNEKLNEFLHPDLTRTLHTWAKQNRFVIPLNAELRDIMKKFYWEEVTHAAAVVYEKTGEPEEEVLKQAEELILRTTRRRYRGKLHSPHNQHA